MRIIVAITFLLCAAICGTTVIAIRSSSTHANTNGAIPVNSPTKEPATGRTPIEMGVVTDDLANFEKATHIYPSIEVLYIQWGKPFPSTKIRTDRGLGVTAMLVLEPSHVKFSEISAGRYDSYISSWARADRKLGLPVILSFAPEANGSWYTWGAKHISSVLYRKVWHHFHDRFISDGARDVTWLWQVNTVWPGSEALALLWPGAAYVNEVGIDGQLRIAKDSYASVFGRTIREIRSITKDPVLISEVAVSKNVKRPVQITDLFKGGRKDHLSAIIFFDVHPRWQIDTNPAALAAFRESLKADRQSTR